MKPTKLYHYTIFPHLAKILASGVIETSRIEREMGDKQPCAWFSSNPRYEQAARKGGLVNGVHKTLTMEDMHHGVGVARIRVPYLADMITWGKYRHLSGLDFRVLRRMEEGGMAWGGDPREWFAMPYPVKEQHWEAVEIWTGSQWVDIERVDFPALCAAKTGIVAERV